MFGGGCWPAMKSFVIIKCHQQNQKKPMKHLKSLKDPLVHPYHSTTFAGWTNSICQNSAEVTQRRSQSWRREESPANKDKHASPFDGCLVPGLPNFLRST